MTVQDVTEIVGGLAADGITVWVDGGWCVDALVGLELREHADLDVAVSRADEKALRGWFNAKGYTPRPRADESAWNFVLGDAQGREIDVHVFEFDERGRNVYGIEYPAESLTGRATLGGLHVHCIAPAWMFRFKTAYEPAPKDLLDVHALAATFGYELPPTHSSPSGMSGS
nr:aminoglycoside nucleotidyltransferase [Dactylosporangium thailandense]